ASLRLRRTCQRSARVIRPTIHLAADEWNKQNEKNVSIRMVGQGGRDAVDNSHHRADSCPDRRIAHLALQQRLGLWSGWNSRAGAGGGVGVAPSGSDLAPPPLCSDGYAKSSGRKAARLLWCVPTVIFGGHRGRR